MTRKVEILPTVMKDAPVEVQVYHMAKMLERELESLHYHVEEVEAELKGDGTKPGLVSLREYQQSMRERNAVSGLEWVQERRRMERGLAMLLLAQAVGIIVALVK